MDLIPLYDQKRAAEQLEKQVALRSEEFTSLNSAARFTEDEDWAMNYQTLKYGPVWRLVSTPEDRSVEEVVITFQGIIYRKDIAPFNPKTVHEKPNVARFLRQSISLCGLQTPSFDKVAKGILQVHTLLARSVGQDEMDNCTMVSESDDGDTLLHMSNRYLTPNKEIQGASRLTIPSSMDPYGHLARIAGRDYAYTEDNQIRYFERRRSAGPDGFKVDECDPIIFRVGDLVEAQVTFIIIPMRNGRKKTGMVLRSLLLLDGTMTQKSMVAEISRRENVPKTDRPLKRRVGYDYEDKPAKSSTEQDDDDAKRPIIKRKLGHAEDHIKETTKRMSDMDIDAEGGTFRKVSD